MRVAFASGTGTHVDQHYGKASSFYVWEVGADDAACVERILPPREGSDLEESLAARADCVADCAILCSLQIGGPAAAKLVRRQVHPMKTTVVTPISDLVTKLQEVLRDRPPPWIRRLVTED